MASRRDRYAVRDPQVEVAMRLMDERRKLVASLGEETWRKRASEARMMIEEQSRRDGSHPMEAALVLTERAEKRLTPVEAKVYGLLFMVVSALEMTNAEGRTP